MDAAGPLGFVLSHLDRGRLLALLRGEVTTAMIKDGALLRRRFASSLVVTIMGAIAVSVPSDAGHRA